MYGSELQVKLKGQVAPSLRMLGYATFIQYINVSRLPSKNAWGCWWGCRISLAVRVVNSCSPMFNSIREGSPAGVLQKRDWIYWYQAIPDIGFVST